MDTWSCDAHILLLAGMSWLCHRIELAGSHRNVLVKVSSMLLFYRLYLFRLSSALTVVPQCFVEHGGVGRACIWLQRTAHRSNVQWTRIRLQLTLPHSHSLTPDCTLQICKGWKWIKVKKCLMPRRKHRTRILPPLQSLHCIGFRQTWATGLNTGTTVWNAIGRSL